MSDKSNTHDDGTPRAEPWLAVMASSILPPVAALYLPAPFLVPLIVVTVVLFGSGLLMLRRQNTRRARERSLDPTEA
jgi:hypothetical protein